MATNSYDSTGVLVLDRITPVINAIFGDLSLRPLDLTRRQWFIATTSDSQHPSWTNITSKLALVAARLGASLSASASRIEVLDALATRLNLSLNEHRNQLAEILAQKEDDAECTSPANLFIVASLLNDGHGLDSITMEGAWYSDDKLHLSQFGGNGLYMSKEVYLQSTSSDASMLGPSVHTALANDDVDAATGHLARFTENLLLGIAKEDIRVQVRARLAPVAG